MSLKRTPSVGKSLISRIFALRSATSIARLYYRRVVAPRKTARTRGQSDRRRGTLAPSGLPPTDATAGADERQLTATAGFQGALATARPVAPELLERSVRTCCFRNRCSGCF